MVFQRLPAETGQAKIQVATNRFRLLGIFLGTFLYGVFAVGFADNLIHAFLAGHYLMLIPLLIAHIILIPACVLSGGWAFLRLVTNVPALVLSEQGITNNTIVYNVTLTWEEIEGFTAFAKGTAGRKGKAILVHVWNKPHVLAQQAKLTQVLLRLFWPLCPFNIQISATNLSYEAMFTLLQTFAKEHLSQQNIFFSVV